MKKLLSVLLACCFLSSCILQSPKYAGVEQVLTLKTGMTKEEISDSLGIPPYDIKYQTDTASQFIYKYRTTDRRTLSLFTKKTNGKRATGKYVDLFVTYDKKGKAIDINSCSECGETKLVEKRINFQAVATFMTATLPAVLIYFGLKDN